MDIVELLAIVQKVADDKGLSKPYIVGGLVRDKLLGRVNEFNDIDITTGDQGIHFLAKAVAEKLSPYNIEYEVMSDGHARIQVGKIQLDFSSNFKIPGIKELLEKSGIEDPSEMRMELYSRDFTCNTALMTLDLKTILDPTGIAIEDIKANKIKTCLPPRLTLGYDGKRVVRVPYLAAKLGFEVDGDIIAWVKQNPGALNTVKAKYISKKINKALSFNRELTLSILDQMDIWQSIPATPSLAEEMAQRINRV